jgi:hypothetical protein
MSRPTRDDDLCALRRHVRESYAGYPEKVAGREEELARITARLETRFGREVDEAARATFDEQTSILNEWLGFFRDAHIRLARKTEEETPAAPRSGPEREPSVSCLDDAAILFRLPTCSPDSVEVIRSLLERHDGELKSCRLLLIDVRGPGGGTDLAWHSVMPLLYTGPYVAVGCDCRASEENAAFLESTAGIADQPDQLQEWLWDLAGRMRSAPGGFVSGVPDQEIRFDQALPFPEKVGILIDGRTASAKEEFVLQARHSRKVTLLGSNTLGCLDYSNQRRIELPSGRRVLFLPMSRSKRLPEHPVDPDGIAPDVRIPETIEDAVAFALGYFAAIPRE